MKKLSLALLFVSTFSFASSNHTIKSSVPAVYISVEQAKQLVESNIWSGAFDACREVTTTPVILSPISYVVTLDSYFNIDGVNGVGVFSCGLK
jgi:hypothetical protein